MEEALKLYQETSITVDNICKIRNISKSSFYRNKPSDLVRGHANKGRVYTFNIDKFRDDSHSKYYWLGFLGADGAIVNNTLSIELQSSDRSQLERFNDWSENTGLIVERVNNGGHKCVKTQINSVELVKYLEKYGLCQNKTKTFQMLNIPEVYMFDFIRGYIDGDGTISTKKGYIYFSIVSGSIELINQIEEIIKTGNKISDYETYYKIGCSGKKALSILSKIYENSTVDTRLDRKYKTYIVKASCRSDSQDKLCELLETP